MKLAAQFIAKFANFITASLSCFDRVIFKGHLRLLSYSKGLEYFVDHTPGIRRNDFMAWANGQSQRIIDHARHLAEQANHPFVHLNRPVRKDDLVQGFPRSQPVDQGLVCVLRCLEHCPSFRLTVGGRRPRFAPARAQRLADHFERENWLKMYDKLPLVLRIETVINDPRLFSVPRRRQRKGQCKVVWCPMNKGVVNLYRYRQVALAANARHLDALSVVEPTRLVQAPLHRLAGPRRVQPGTTQRPGPLPSRPRRRPPPARPAKRRSSCPPLWPRPVRPDPTPTT